MKNPSIIVENLSHFHGSSTFYKHHLGNLALTYTEGVLYLADSADSFWLIDLILSYQLNTNVKTEYFQSWQMLVQDSRAIVKCLADNEICLAEQLIAFTDFPLHEIKLWLVNGVLMLPSEY